MDRRGGGRGQGAGRQGPGTSGTGRDAWRPRPKGAQGRRGQGGAGAQGPGRGRLRYCGAASLPGPGPGPAPPRSPTSLPGAPSTPAAPATCTRGSLAPRSPRGWPSPSAASCCASWSSAPSTREALPSAPRGPPAPPACRQSQRGRRQTGRHADTVTRRPRSAHPARPRAAPRLGVRDAGPGLEAPDAWGVGKRSGPGSGAATRGRGWGRWQPATREPSPRPAAVARSTGPDRPTPARGAKQHAVPSSAPESGLDLRHLPAASGVPGRLYRLSESTGKQ